MITEESLSTYSVPSQLIGSKKHRIDNLKDYEDGGVSLNDASLGLLYQQWIMWVSDNIIYLKSNISETPIIVYSGIDITYITFTFDQNMNLIYLYKDSNIWNFVWFDSQTENTITTSFENNYHSFQLILDDKREGAESTNDVLLFYVRDGYFCYRQQRDRYDIEIVLSDNIGELLLQQVSVNIENRLQFKFIPIENFEVLNFTIYANLLNSDALEDYIIYIDDVLLSSKYIIDGILYFENGTKDELGSNWKRIYIENSTFNVLTSIRKIEKTCNLKIYKQQMIISDSDFRIKYDETSNLLINVIQNQGDIWSSSNTNIVI